MFTCEVLKIRRTEWEKRVLIPSASVDHTQRTSISSLEKEELEGTARQPAV